MKISILVPCYNEELSVESCIKSCLNQNRKFDEIIFVDDSSTDSTNKIIAKYSDRLTLVKTPKNTGNKSHAQEYGMTFVTGDIVITTDADTVLDPNFASEMEKEFADPDIAAVAGYVSSVPHNWLTSCRAFDYIVGQNIHKLAQSYMNYIFVMPGAASAFRSDIFKKYIDFDHDTITEDLDFTYKLHHKHFKIVFTKKAISYTQDPETLGGYINQTRRWFGGGWQNLLKHKNIVKHPIRAFELTLLYAEGLVFSILLFLIPLINLWVWFWMIIGYLIMVGGFAVWASIVSRRKDILLVPFTYILLVYTNAYIYLEQFIREVILGKKNLVWYKPKRFFIEEIQKTL